jgi:hypothetical protein
VQCRPPLTGNRKLNNDGTTKCVQC